MPLEFPQPLIEKPDSGGINNLRCDDVSRIPAWSWMRIELGQRSIHRIRKRSNHGLLVAEGQEHSTYRRTHSHFWGEATWPSRETLL